jgi:tetratricopeptide (TPR) repeat protein
LPEDAEVSCRQALAALDVLLAAWPDERRYRRQRAAIFDMLGLAAAAQDRPDEAIEAYKLAVDLWSKLIAERPNVVDERRRMASCLERLGLLLHEAGRWDDADFVFQRGRLLCQQLPNDIADDPEISRDLVGFLSRLAHESLDSGRWSESLDLHSQAVQALKRLAAGPDGRTEDRERLVRTVVDQAGAFRECKQPAAAEQCLLEAKARAERLAAHSPAKGRYRALVAMVLNHFAALIECNPGRGVEARAAYERAVTLLETVAGQPSATPDDRSSLAATCGRLANLLADQGLCDLAQAAYRKEIACESRLVEERPRNIWARFARGRALHNLADLLRDRGGRCRDEALDLEHEAIKELSVAYNQNVRNPEFRTALSYAAWALCVLELDRNDYRAAAAAVDQYQQVEAAGFEEALESVRFLCRCASLCRRDGAIPKTNRERLASSYADRAVQALKSAVQSGYHDARDLESAGTYEPLRGRDDFALLVREAEARTKLLEADVKPGPK